MTLEVSINAEAAAKLREKAAAVGEDIAAYAAGVLERSAERPLSLAQISGPVADEFRESGMSEDELSEILEAAKHDIRRRRRGA